MLAGAVALLLPLALAQTPAQAQGGDIVVFAAASLKNALDAINAQCSSTGTLIEDDVRGRVEVLRGWRRYFPAYVGNRRPAVAANMA